MLFPEVEACRKWFAAANEGDLALARTLIQQHSRLLVGLQEEVVGPRKMHRSALDFAVRGGLQHLSCTLPRIEPERIAVVVGRFEFACFLVENGAGVSELHAERFPAWSWSNRWPWPRLQHKTLVSCCGFCSELNIFVV